MSDDRSPQNDGYYKVTFLVKKTKTVVTKDFDSPYLARLFVNKVKRGNKCTIISCPLFR